MRGGLQKSLLSPPFFTPLGSGSISRLFLAIRSLVFSAEWLFYQPLWLFSPSRLPAQCERGLDAPLSLQPPPPPPCFSHAPFLPPSLSSALLSWRDCHPVCVYRWPALSSAPQQMNLLPSKSPEMATNSFLSFTVTHSYLSSPHLHRCTPRGRW